MLKVKNYMGRNDSILEFAVNTFVFNESNYSYSLRKFLKDSGYSYKNEDLKLYLSAYKYRVSEVLSQAMMSGESSYILLENSDYLENNESVEQSLFICDFVSIFGFKMKLEKNEENRLIIRVIEKPEEIDFSFFVILSEDEWYEVISENHTGHEISSPKYSKDETEESKSNNQKKYSQMIEIKKPI